NQSVGEKHSSNHSFLLIYIRYTKKECDQCQKTFANSKTLKKHIQAVHSKLKPYVCQVCGHGSATKSMLQVHLRQHTGEKPFSCPTCPFTTGDHNTLRRHRMRHSGERPYQCNYCPYSSIQSTSLRHHLATWHQKDSNGEVDTDRGKVEGKKQKSYKCKQCFYSTDDQDSLLQHLTLDHPSPDSRGTLMLFIIDFYVQLHNPAEKNSILKSPVLFNKQDI
ncbi:hypothetical protein AAG570_013843, partial [Ranatra chinensis]